MLEEGDAIAQGEQIDRQALLLMGFFQQQAGLQGQGIGALAVAKGQAGRHGRQRKAVAPELPFDAKFFGTLLIPNAYRGLLIVEIQGNEVQTGDITVNKIVLQRHKRVEQVPIQAGEVNQGPYSIRYMRGVIQALHVGQAIIGIQLDIAEGRRMLPDHRVTMSCTSYLLFIDLTVSGQQTHGEWHNGLAQAADFHPVGIHRTARRIGLWYDLNTAYSIVQGDALFYPLPEEPGEIPSAHRFRGLAHVGFGDKSATSFQGEDTQEVLKHWLTQQVMEHGIEQRALFLVYKAQALTILSCLERGIHWLVLLADHQTTIRYSNGLFAIREVGEPGTLPGEKIPVNPVLVIEPAQGQICCQPLANPALGVQVVCQVQAPPLLGHTPRHKVLGELVHYGRYPHQVA